MSWIYTVVMSVVTAAVISMILSGLGADKPIFRCARTLINLIMCVFVTGTFLNTDIDLFEGFVPELSDNTKSLQSDGVIKSFTNNLEAQIEADITELNANSEPNAVVMAQLNDDYQIEIINVSISVKEGDRSGILNKISKNYMIDKEKIIIARE